MFVKDLIKNLELLDSKIEFLAKNDNDFASKFFPYTIEDTIAILEKVDCEESQVK